MSNKPKVRYTVDWKAKGDIAWHKGNTIHSKYKARRIVCTNKGLLGRGIRYRMRLVQDIIE